MNRTGQKKNQSDATAAHFGEPLFFCPFVLMKRRDCGIWYGIRLSLMNTGHGGSTENLAGYSKSIAPARGRCFLQCNNGAALLESLITKELT